MPPMVASTARPTIPQRHIHRFRSRRFPWSNAFVTAASDRVCRNYGVRAGASYVRRLTQTRLIFRGKSALCLLRAESAHESVADLRRIAVGLGDARLAVDAGSDQGRPAGERLGEQAVEIFLVG